MPKAVIDVGSNSLLLTVAEFQEGDWHTLFESSEVTALGEGTKTTGRLSKAGMQATLSALQRAFENARSYGAEPTACGTMALRIAANAREFLQLAEQQGTPVKVIEGELEAALSLASVTQDPMFQSNPRLTVMDIGGHSTEIAIAENGVETYRQSFPIGTLTLRSGSLDKESPTPMDLLTACKEIDLILSPLEPQQGVAVAVGASATNLVAIRDQILVWDPAKVHGSTLDFEYISKFVGISSKLTDEGRAALPGIEKGRERTIHIGALLLERCLQRLQVEECRVSVRGWRYAMLSQL